MLIKHAAILEKCETIDELWAGVVNAFFGFGLDQAIYLSVDSSFENLFVLSTMPDLYNETPPSEDPFLIHACTRYEILTIGTEFIAEHPYISDTDRAFIERGAEQGLCAGLALPMRLKGADRFGGFVIGNALDRTRFLKRIMPHAEDIRMFCMIIHRRIEELIATPAPTDAPTERQVLAHNALSGPFDALSPRETEVLMLLAQGQTRKATAHLCNLSVHTVSDYAKSGYKKLGVRNRAEVAALLYGQTQAPTGADTGAKRAGP